MRGIGYFGCLVTAGVLSTVGNIAAAQAPAAEPEQFIVTGTRETAQTQFTALSPVDVFSKDTITSVSTDHLDEVLATIVPSYDVKRLPASDGPEFIKPASLDGLSPDMTLVLLNGKRFHRSAFIEGSGQSAGSQSADLAQIPTFAIGHVEVLRDGASAQYGSDAIAGVINILLDTKPGFEAYGEGSQFYAGDGGTGSAGARAGFALGDGGHLVVTTQLERGEPTSRTTQRPDAIALQAANPSLTVPNPVQRWGNPAEETFKSAVDAALPIGDFAEAYAFGTFGTGNSVADINWRNPATNPTIFGNAASQKIFPGYTLNSLYPAGFTPHEGINYMDGQGVVGLRDTRGEDLTWDLSTSWGRNDSQFLLFNSINASLGPSSPVNFNLGHQVQTEVNVNFDSVYQLRLQPLPDPINIAFGAERRDEAYKIAAGDYGSYAVGPGAAAGLAPEANGFPGFSPSQAGNWNQTSYAGYIDITVPVTKAWNVEFAGRDESYDEFGNTFNYKFATRYELTPELAVRGAYSTGFKAPTAGELNSTSTSQSLDSATLTLITSGRLSPLNPVAQFFGAKPLTPEESKTYTAGAIWKTDFGVTGSLDAYQIDVTKRFSQSQTFLVTPAEQAQLIASGVPGAGSITQVSFFTNDFDTRTRGIDAVASYRFKAGPGTADLTAAYSYTDTEVTGGSLAANGDETQRVLFNNGTPKHNATTTATYEIGPVKLMARMRYYGGWTDASGTAAGTSVFQRFGGIPFVDTSVTYDVDDHYSLRLGAENVFDTYPDRATNQANRGLLYSRNTPYDTNGGLFYLRLDVKY